MAQLIDIADVISAIEALEDRNNCGTYDFIEAKSIAYKQVREAVNALEVKEVDLEKEITIYLGDNWKQDTPIEVQNDMISYAKHFFELGLKAQKGE